MTPKKPEDAELERAAEAHCSKFSPHPKEMKCDCGWCVGRRDGEALFLAGAAFQKAREDTALGVALDALWEAREHVRAVDLYRAAKTMNEALARIEEMVGKPSLGR